MTIRSIIAALSFFIPLHSFAQSTQADSAKTIVRQAVATVQLLPPPPPGFKGKFKTVNQWLTTIVKGNKPQKAISKYNIGCFTAPDGYTLSLTGVNTDINNGITETRIDYTPKAMYCDLPKSYYQNLTREQLLAKVVAELKTFTSTNTFKNSFLANGDNIALETNGEVIWAKK